jgi:hypothetical protein
MSRVATRVGGRVPTYMIGPRSGSNWNVLEHGQFPVKARLIEWCQEMRPSERRRMKRLFEKPLRNTGSTR